MKNLYYILAFILFGTANVFAQANGEITPKGIIYPRYTDANRPAGPLIIGNTIFNTSQNTHQYWNGSSWTNVSTPGSGGGPWSAVGNSIYNNTGSRVGINSPNPSADLEIQGAGGLLVSEPYTVTTDPPTTTTTMPYNGTLPTITANAGRILDPGGTGNFLTNTNYTSYIRLDPNSGGTSGFRFTFESLDLGNSRLIFSTSSDVNNTDAYILDIYQGSNYAIGRPFTIGVSSTSYIHIHNIIGLGGTPAAGFQLLFEKLTTSNPPRIYSEAIGGGLVFNSRLKSFSTGLRSRAIGYGSTASGSITTASGDYSTAIGYGSTASGSISTAMGYYANTNGKDRSFSIEAYGTRATNDKDLQMKMHFNEFQFLTGTDKDLIITDGRITTNNSLAVFGSSNISLGNYGYLFNGSSNQTGFYSGTNTIPYSIYASSRIVGTEFDAFSDARHKKLRSYSNGSKDLALLNQLKVSNYTFIDTVGKGGKMQLGFIAQEVEKIVPDAVNKIQDYIPSIYDMAKSIAYDAAARTLTVSTNNAHDFQAKDEIKLISLDKEHKVKVASIIDAHTFVVANWEKPVDKLFVFGKRVDDFRTVDYDRLFMLGISSIQELSRKIEQLEKENHQMRNQVGELKAMILKTENKEKISEK